MKSFLVVSGAYIIKLPINNTNYLTFVVVYSFSSFRLKFESEVFYLSLKKKSDFLKTRIPNCYWKIFKTIIVEIFQNLTKHLDSKIVLK